MTDKREAIQLAHGGGGRLTRELIDREIVPRFGDGPLCGLPDAASLGSMANLVFTTDSFVVQPWRFPGGNIGDLAVHGTVNDLAVAGAEPRFLSLALILEEGFDLASLREILDAVECAAERCGVTIVTGDTKVVPRGQCDGIYVNTAGVGEGIAGLSLGVERIRRGDVVLVSGTLAEHGFAILSARESMPAVQGVTSDSGPVHRLVAAAAAYGDAVRFMRDPTRGGLATVLTEVAEGAEQGIELEEDALPLSSAGKALSELLGLDPLHVASEGRVVAVCRAEAADGVLSDWRALPEGEGAVRIGVVTGANAGRVVLNTLMGGRRLVDVPRGELLPRIC